jgi:protein-arginine kinase activator protein McsA
MEKDYKKIVLEIDNAMQRWHLGRDNDDETLELINKIMLDNGMLLWENGKLQQADVIKSVCPKCGSKYYDEDNNVKQCQDCYTVY